MFSVNFKTRLQNLVRSLFLVTLQHPGQKLHFQSSKPCSSSSIVNFEHVDPDDAQYLLKNLYKKILVGRNVEQSSQEKEVTDVK